MEIRNFISAKRKPVSLSELDLVRTGFLIPGDTAPRLIQPGPAEIDLADWAKGNREFINTQLLTHGAVLFRGFGLKSVAEFEACARAVCPELFAEYGDLPREGLNGAIYQSTPYPADQTILFHNEASHTHRWPMRQWFFCVKPAQQGGETPIVDCRQVYRRLDPNLIARFRQKQVMYVRNFIPGLDVSWQEFFKTTERSAVEAYCRNAGIDLEWKGNDGLRIRQTCPAVARHPQTGEQLFFNQVQLHHVSCVAPAVRQSIESLFREEDLPRNVYYGDGSPIEDSVVEEIKRTYWQAAVSFPWQEGDVLLLDNMLTAHARNPYVGPRKIVVAMAEMVGNKDVQS